MATHHDLTLPNGVQLHYLQSRRAAPPAPTLLLLHGYPASSNQFRTLVPLLAPHANIIAPDLPGFGFTKTPSGYTHSFANLADTVGLFLDALEVKSFIAYIFDYGSPTLFRLALHRPEAVKGIITQNGNAYTEGLGPAFWAPLQQWWASGDEHAPIREVIRTEGLSLAATRSQYVDNVPKELLPRVDPAGYTLDHLLNVASPEQQEVQLTLFWDYRNNVEQYPAWQQWLRQSGVPVLAVWGGNDSIFLKAGAEAFKRDVKDIEVVLLDGGHFVLETHVEEVAERIKAFLTKFE